MEMIRSHDETIAGFEFGYFENKILENIGNLLMVETMFAIMLQELLGYWWKFCSKEPSH